MKTLYTAIDPAGVSHERTAEATVYTHLVMILPSFGYAQDHARRMAPDISLADSREAEVLAQQERGFFLRWQFMGWCTSLEAAIRLATQQREKPQFADVCTIELKSEPAPAK